MKKYFTLVCLTLLFVNAYSQSECRNIKIGAMQWHIFFKLGAKHNLTTYRNITASTNRILNTPTGFSQLEAISNIEYDKPVGSNLEMKDFTLSFPAGLYFASPFMLTTGIEYQPVVFRNLYRTKTIDENGYFYYVDELNTMQSFSIPVFFDTRKLYQKFTAYAGIRFHFNAQNWQLQNVSWNNPAKLRKINFDSNEILKTNLSYALGVTYSFLSFEFSMHPNTFFNTSYKDDFGLESYSFLENKSIKSITLSVMIGKLKDKIFSYEKDNVNPWTWHVKDDECLKEKAKKKYSIKKIEEKGKTSYKVLPYKSNGKTKKEITVEVDDYNMFKTPFKTIPKKERKILKAFLNDEFKKIEDSFYDVNEKRKDYSKQMNNLFSKKRNHLKQKKILLKKNEKFIKVFGNLQGDKEKYTHRGGGITTKTVNKLLEECNDNIDLANELIKEMNTLVDNMQGTEKALIKLSDKFDKLIDDVDNKLEEMKKLDYSNQTKKYVEIRNQIKSLKDELMNEIRILKKEANLIGLIDILKEKKIKLIGVKDEIEKQM